MLTTIVVLIAVLGIGGGIATATGVDRFPSDWLVGTPFRSYLIPGIILALAVGGTAAVASIGMLMRTTWGPLSSIVARVTMMGFLVGEVLILDQPVEPTLTELVFFGVGTAMALLGWYLGGLGRTRGSDTADTRTERRRERYPDDCA